MKSMKLVAACAVALLTVSGCNTIAGLGKDLQAAGSAISETSDEVRSAVVTPDRTVQTASACDEPAGRTTRANCR